MKTELTAQIVVSTYNQEKYIADCLKSILNQITTYSFTILVSDDNSKDQTANILKDFETRFPEKIKVIYHNTNQGAAKNYLELHGQTTADIIFHMDGDDVMLPGKIQRQCEIFENRSVQFCTHASTYFNDELTQFKKAGCLSSSDALTYFTANELAGWGSISVHSSYTYRRSSRKSGDLNREFMEWFFAMDSLVDGGLGVFINDYLLDYRFNTNGQSYLSTKKGRLKAYTINLVDLKYYFTKYPKFRTAIYANTAITFLGIFKNIKFFDKNYFLFLLKNIFYFRPIKVKEIFFLRRKMAPQDL